MASEPNIFLDNGGSLSLQHLLAFPTFGASHPHQAQFAPPPPFRSSASLLMEAHQAQAQLQQLRMVPFYPEMQMAAGFGQHHIPMVSGSQNVSSAAMALAFSRVEQDQASLAQSLYTRGSLLG
jgi:hypothetical protein